MFGTLVRCQFDSETNLHKHTFSNGLFLQSSRWLQLHTLVEEIAGSNLDLQGLCVIYGSLLHESRWIDDRYTTAYRPSLHSTISLLRMILAR